MPFIPHTTEEVAAMLAVIGVERIDDLFDEIPPDLMAPGLPNLPPALAEMEIGRLMQQRSREDGQPLCFISAGAYEHHIPAAVWQIATRGEFYSAYTPYQAEANQGTLQVLYEFQSMMTALTGLDISNASLYDGASALAEAVLMAVRHHRKRQSHRVLVPRALHPAYRRTLRTIVGQQDIELLEIPFDRTGGHTPLEQLDAFGSREFTALVINQPNFFGVLEEVDALTDWAHQHDSLVIGVVNPVALALLSPPGEWGKQGADIACGEAQPLGMPLASGGPYAGFLCCRQALVRQLPGRIAGRTLDQAGKPGFTFDPAGPRATHPPRQGDLEHLHQPGTPGNRRHHPHGPAGRRRVGAGSRRVPRQHRKARRPTVRDTRCRVPVRPPRLSRKGPAASRSHRRSVTLLSRAQYPRRIRPGAGLSRARSRIARMCHRATHRGRHGGICSKARTNHRDPYSGTLSGRAKVMNDRRFSVYARPNKG